MYKKFNDRLEAIILISESVIAFVLLVLVMAGIGYLLVNFWEMILVKFPNTSTDSIHKILDIALIVFITIELFRIAIAYMEKEGVLSIVIEAGFVAIARKFVLYDFKDTGLWGAVALSVLLASLAITYYTVEHNKNSLKKN